MLILSDLEKEEFSWLKDSDFYSGLDLYIDDVLDIKYCSKYTENIDLFLEVINLWGVNYCPLEFFSLLIKKRPTEKLDELYKITGYDFYRMLRNSIRDYSEFLIISLATLACKFGHLDLLVYAYSVNCEASYFLPLEAAKNGHLNCLKFLHENKNFQGKICPWDEGVCAMASYRGHLDCLIYAHKNGCPWDEDTIYNAVRGDHIDCLVYSHKKGCPYRKVYLGEGGEKTRIYVNSMKQENNFKS